jgi:hypothetical protein
MRILSRLWGIALAVALVPGAEGLAAGEGSGEGGPTVRVTAPGVVVDLEGEILSADDEAISVRARDGGQVHVIPADAVTRVEVRRKDHGRRRGAGLGALTGLAVGAVLGFAAGEDCSAPDAPSIICFSRGETALVLGVLGAGVGAGLGALVVPRERWELVEYRSLTAGITLPSSRRRDVGVFLAASF